VPVAGLEAQVCHADLAQWHWGNIGSFIAGTSALLIAAAAIIRSPAALREWMARQKAQAEAAQEEAETIRLDRRRGLSGWSATGVEVYGVTLVTSEDELRSAASEIASGRPSAYVTVRVSESEYDTTARGHALQQLISRDGYLSRAPQ
jgi:hypothetical protein